MNIKENKPALPKYAQCFKLAEKLNFSANLKHYAYLGKAGLFSFIFINKNYNFTFCIRKHH